MSGDVGADRIQGKGCTVSVAAGPSLPLAAPVRALAPHQRDRLRLHAAGVRRWPRHSLGGASCSFAGLGIWRGNAGGLWGVSTQGCRGVCSLRASSDRRVGQWWFGDLPGAAVYSARRDGGLIQKAFLAVGKWEMGVVTFSLSARPVFLFYGVFQVDKKIVYSISKRTFVRCHIRDETIPKHVAGGTGK